MTTTYHLHANDLSIELLDSIKAAFKDKTIDITISEVMDETAYLLASRTNEEHLEKSMNEAAEGNVAIFTVEEFQEKYGSK